jgi:AraC family transcriptional regulator
MEERLEEATYSKRGKVMPNSNDLPSVRPCPVAVKFSPPDLMRRRMAVWEGIKGDVIEMTRLERFEYGVRSPYHILIAAERGAREAGETVIEGLEKSTQREFSRKLSFIPAGHEFHGWQDPRVLGRCTYLYIDPRGPLVDPELGFSEIDFKPRLFFFDSDIWETALKLKTQVENPTSAGYAEALGTVLAHELVRMHRGASSTPVLRGGLAGWQKKRVADYIDEHLNENISLRELAGIAQLSPYHFSRAFKQSFGTPPHRYHMSRRIERAKSMLEVPARSVTEVGMMLGFAETSSFTTSFRRAVGVTPSDYRRSVA